jgi:hypothetical protein
LHQEADVVNSYAAGQLLSADFEQLRHRIVPRLIWPDDPSIDEDVLQRSAGSGFTVVLTIPLEVGYLTIRTFHARRWGRDVAELWAVALHNLRREPITVVRAPRPEVEFSLLGGQTLHFSANLLRLDELVSRPCPYGTYVILPHDYVLGFLPIRDIDSFAKAAGLRSEAQVMAAALQKHGGHTSPDLFWWSEGVMEWVNVPPFPEEENDPETPLDWVVSPRLYAILDRLSGPEHDR